MTDRERKIVRAVLLTRDEIAFTLTAIRAGDLQSDAREGAIAALGYMLGIADGKPPTKD